MYQIYQLQSTFFLWLLYMQERYVNMPYQSWEVLPLGLNHTKLTIDGGTVQIAVEIKVQGQCVYVYTMYT